MSNFNVNALLQLHFNSCLHTPAHPPTLKYAQKRAYAPLALAHTNARTLTTKKKVLARAHPRGRRMASPSLLDSSDDDDGSYHTASIGAQPLPTTEVNRSPTHGRGVVSANGDVANTQVSQPACSVTECRGDAFWNANHQEHEDRLPQLAGHAPEGAAAATSHDLSTASASDSILWLAEGALESSDTEAGNADSDSDFKRDAPTPTSTLRVEAAPDPGRSTSVSAATR